MRTVGGSQTEDEIFTKGEGEERRGTMGWRRERGSDLKGLILQFIIDDIFNFVKVNVVILPIIWHP